MLVLCTCINIEVVNELVTKLCLGQHSLNNFSHKSLSTVGLSHQLCRCGLTLTAGITGVTQINPVSPLLTSQDNLIGIKNDNVVTAVNVRSEICLILTAEQLGNLHGEAAQDLVLGINHDPFLINGSLVGRNSLVT